MLKLLVVLLVVVGIQSQRIGNTKDKLINGYKFRKDVEDYLNASLVASDIMKALATVPPRWESAYKTYSKQNLDSVPAKPIKFYAQARLGAWAGQPFHDLYRQYYDNRTTFVDDYIGGFNDTIKVEVGLLWYQIGWMGNQLDISKIFILTRPVEGTPEGKKQSGGIDQVDDTAGIYFGYPSTPTLWAFHANIATSWKTCAPRPSINARVPPLLDQMRTETIMNVKTQARNFTKWGKSYDEFWQAMVTGFLRAILYRTEQKKATSQARASGYLTIIRPLLKDQKAAIDLQKLLSKKTIATPARVRAYVQEITAKQGILASDVLCK